MRANADKNFGSHKKNRHTRAGVMRRLSPAANTDQHSLLYIRHLVKAFWPKIHQSRLHGQTGTQKLLKMSIMAFNPSSTRISFPDTGAAQKKSEGSRSAVKALAQCSKREYRAGTGERDGRTRSRESRWARTSMRKKKKEKRKNEKFSLDTCQCLGHLLD